LNYFANDKLVDYMTTGHNRFENDNIDPQQILLTEAAETKKLVSQKMKTIR